SSGPAATWRPSAMLLIQLEASSHRKGVPSRAGTTDSTTDRYTTDDARRALRQRQSSWTRSVRPRRRCCVSPYDGDTQHRRRGLTLRVQLDCRCRRALRASSVVYRSVVESVVPARLGTPFRWLLASSWMSNIADGLQVAAGPL